MSPDLDLAEPCPNPNWTPEFHAGSSDAGRLDVHAHLRRLHGAHTSRSPRDGSEPLSGVRESDAVRRGAQEAPSARFSRERREPLLGGEGAEVFERAVEEVLAQVEEARPEVARSGAEPHAGCRREAFEGAHEDRELQVRLRDPHGRRVDAGAAEDRLPLDELRRPGSPYQERPSAWSASSSSR